MHNRIGEKKHSWFRCQRYYHTSDGWWFQTREKTEMGPFDSQKDAEMELLVYVRETNFFPH